jgi:hypothetical protein
MAATVLRSPITASIADDRFEPFIDAPTKFGEGPLQDH